MKDKKVLIRMENRCICCGEIIPEGRQTCPNCVAGIKPETEEQEEE